MPDQYPGVVSDRFAHPLAGLAADLRVAEVVPDLSQITQQRPLSQRGEKPRSAQRPQRALHAARRPRQGTRIGGHHRRIGAGRLTPPCSQQIPLEKIQALRPDQRVPSGQVPARRAEQITIERAPHLRARQLAARQPHPTTQRRSPHRMQRLSCLTLLADPCTHTTRATAPPIQTPARSYRAPESTRTRQEKGATFCHVRLISAK
jgi:hypothetical protein